MLAMSAFGISAPLAAGAQVKGAVLRVRDQQGTPVPHALVEVEGGEKKMLHYDTCESCGGIWVEGPEEGDIPETLDWKGAARQVVGFYRLFARK